MTANPSEPHIGLVVEGQGDVRAVPELLRKWMLDRSDYRDVLGKPVSCNGRPKALAPNGLEGFVATATTRPGCICVIVVLDSDGDAVCELGPTLLKRAKSVTGKAVAVCLADRNYEDWLYASVESLNLPGALPFNDAKNGLHAIKSALRPSSYVKPTWQPRLTNRMDLALATRRSRSLSRMLLKFEEMLSLLNN